MKTLKNIKMNLLVATMSQIMTVVFALIVPRLMISYYGAQIHGLISVITGLITYLTLIESGLSAASIQGLYKPLNEKNKYDTHCIYLSFYSITRNIIFISYYFNFNFRVSTNN